MAQEFLASFAVDIDEAGVSRLERILENNRELARKLADAFDEARGAMEGLIRPLTEDMEGILPFPRPEAAAETPGTAGNFPVGLDFAEAGKQLETFLAGAKKQLRLSADGSGIVSAVSAAISRARSMLAGAGLTLPVQVETRGAAEIPARPAPDTRPAVFPQEADAARESIPAAGQTAEPVRAAYISEEAREAARVVNMPEADQKPERIVYIPEPVQEPARVMYIPETVREAAPAESAALFAGIPALLSVAADAAAPRVTQNMTTRNVSAPVNIRVEAASADPEAVGRSIYSTAEQHLLRTLQEA